MRVVAAGEGDLTRFPGERAVDENAGVGGEGVLLANELFATVGDVSAVRAPAKVCDVREGTVGQLKELIPKDVHALCDNAVAESSYKAVGNLRAPVVPVAVHEVLRGIGLGLVQRRIRVRRHLNVAVHALHKYHLALVRREEVIVYSARDIGLEAPLAKLSVLVCSLVELAALQEED